MRILTMDQNPSITSEILTAFHQYSRN